MGIGLIIYINGLTGQVWYLLVKMRTRSSHGKWCKAGLWFWNSIELV